MTKKFYTILLSLLGFVAYGQEKVTIPTPEAASLQKVSQNQMSYPTGSAVVGLPLYTLAEGGLSVPIGLSYSGSSGIKVDEAATWVGLGWDLSAGGQITRIVRDKPDESHTMSFVLNERGGLTSFQLGVSAAGAKRGVSWNNEKLNYRGGWALAGNVTKSGNSLNADYNQNDPALFDLQPDLYIVNIGGEVIKFTFDESGQPVVINNKDVKISYKWSNYDPSEYYTSQAWSVFATFDPVGFLKSAAGGELGAETKAEINSIASNDDLQWINKLNSVVDIQQNSIKGVTLGLDQFFRKTKTNPNIIGFMSWIITTSDGVEYHFGEEKDVNDVSYIDYSFNYQNLFNNTNRLSIALSNLQSKIPSSWHLRKIVSPYGLYNPTTNTSVQRTEIVFKYDRTGQYSPYHSTDILVEPNGPCDYPTSMQPKWNINLKQDIANLVSAGLSLTGLPVGVSYTAPDPLKNKAFVELNTMVVYGKQVKEIESPNFRVVFNYDSLNAAKTTSFKKIIPNYKINDFYAFERKDLQGEIPMSTQELKQKMVGTLTTSGIIKSNPDLKLTAVLGAVPQLGYDDGSLSVQTSILGKFMINYQGKIYRENLLKPYLHQHYCLKNIVIIDKSTQKKKGYYFDYDYFDTVNQNPNLSKDVQSDLPTNYYDELHDKYNTEANHDKYRLRLKGVYEMVFNENNISLLPGHTFEYNSKPLPRRLSMAVDHWGYYNGEHLNRNKTQFIARMTYSTYDVNFNVVSPGGQYVCPNSSNRDANLEFCKAGVLEKISFPTGGVKQYYYELHTAFNYPKPVGGLRVNKIETFDPVLNKTYTETYSYVRENAAISSGKISVYPEYYYTHKQATIPRIIHADYTNYLVSNYINDSYIHYDRVVVRQTGNGYTVYEFNNNEKPATYKRAIYDLSPNTFTLANYTNLLDNPNNTPQGTLTGYVDENYFSNLNNKPDYDYSKGSLYKMTVYTENNLKVSETINNYDILNIPIVKNIETADPIRRLPFVKLSVGVSIGIFVTPFPPFVLPSVGFNLKDIDKRTVEPYLHTIRIGKFHLKEQTTKNFDLTGQNPIESVVSYEYSPNHHEVVKQKTTNSNGDIVENIKKYSFDFPSDTTVFVYQTPTTFPAPYFPRLSKKERYMNLLVEEITKRNNKVISGKINIFHENEFDNSNFNLLRLKDGLLKEEYILETETPISDYLETQNHIKLNFNYPNGESTYESFLSFDLRYKLRTQYSEYNDRGLLVKSNKVGFPSTSITYGYNNLIPTAVTQESNKGNRTVSYELIPLFGVTKTTNPDGTELNYKYDPVGRLVEVRDKNGKLIKSYTYNYKSL